MSSQLIDKVEKAGRSAGGAIANGQALPGSNTPKVTYFKGFL
jgi:hypothetical protein